MTDIEELDYFTEVLVRLDALKERAPKNSPLAKLVTEARGSVDALTGYFIEKTLPQRLQL